MNLLRHRAKNGIHNKEKGSVLLLSLLIVIGTVAASVSFGTVILSSYQRARLTVFSQNAFYDAESGMEQALYQIRKEGRTPNTLSSCISGCAISASYSKQAEIPSIPRDQSVQFDLVDPSGGASAGIQCFQIVCPLTNNVWLDVNTLPLSNSGGNWVIEAESTRHTFQPCDGQSNNTITVKGLDKARSYIVRIKSFYADSPELSFQAFSEESPSCLNAVSLASKMTLTSTGVERQTEQKIIVDMPRRTPFSAFYDYVVFSEETIQKLQTSGFVN